MKLLVFAAITIALGGCAGIKPGLIGDAAYSAVFRLPIEDAAAFSPEWRTALDQLNVMDCAEGRAIVPKGEVSGLACKLTVGLLIPLWTWRPQLNDVNGRSPEEVATNQMKLKAVLRGANAVIAPKCVQSSGIDWGNNCFESWVCTGQAATLSQ